MKPCNRTGELCVNNKFMQEILINMKNGRSQNIDAVQSTSVENGTKMTCTFHHFQLFFDIFFVLVLFNSPLDDVHTWIFFGFHDFTQEREKKRKDNVCRWEMMLCAESDISRVFRWKSFVTLVRSFWTISSICAPALLDMSQLSSWSPIDTRLFATIPKRLIFFLCHVHFHSVHTQCFHIKQPDWLN